MSANQLRLWFSTFAYQLVIDLREASIKSKKPTPYAGIIRVPAENRRGGESERAPRAGALEQQLPFPGGSGGLLGAAAGGAGLSGGLREKPEPGNRTRHDPGTRGGIAPARPDGGPKWAPTRSETPLTPHPKDLKPLQAHAAENQQPPISSLGNFRPAFGAQPSGV
ncbi:MAG: hypothetical protein R3F11_11425 [Verrucomicrobiales bacterium]